MYVEKEQTNLKQMDIKMCKLLVLCSGLLLQVFLQFLYTRKTLSFY